MLESVQLCFSLSIHLSIIFYRELATPRENTTGLDKYIYIWVTFNEVTLRLTLFREKS